MTGRTTAAQAQGLVAQAHAALLDGDAAQAQHLLQAAARSWAAAGNDDEQQRCARLAASLARHQTQRDLAGVPPERDIVLAAALDLAAGPRPEGAPDLADARATALQKRDLPGYLAACIAQAQLANARGDRVAAYRSLAVGWVTLADVTGPRPAEASFRPQLEQLRQEWGAEEFAAVRATYEREAGRR